MASRLRPTVYVMNRDPGIDMPLFSACDTSKGRHSIPEGLFFRCYTALAATHISHAPKDRQTWNSQRKSQRCRF